MAIKQDPSTILGTQNNPIASSTEIALAAANGGIFQYQTTKDVYITAVSQRILNQQVFNNNTVNEVAGSELGEIQFHNGGKFDSDRDFRYDPTTDSLLVSGNLYAGKIILEGTSSLQIPGGLPGDILSTNGAGVVSWRPEVSTLPASNITFVPSGDIVSTNVQSAIAELDTKKLALAGGTMTGPLASSSTITAMGNITGGNILTGGNVNSGNVNATGGIFTYVTGDGGNLSNITGANVVGNVTSAITANFANYAGNVTVAAQPNITSVGTLTSLAVAGNANTGNIGATGGIFTYVTGDGANLTGITTANFANYAGNVTVATQPNITSVGTLTSLAVAGNANTGNIGATGGIFTYVTGDGGNLSNITGANVVGNVTSAITANFANFAGNVTVAAQPNITSVGTLTSLAVAGNANVGNIGAAGGIFTYVTGDGGNLSNINSANITGAAAFATVANSVAGANVVGNVTSAITANFANYAGNVTVAAQPNITSVGTLTSLAVAGNANTGNIGATGGIFTYVTGDGGNLSNITGANVVGNVDSAITANFANYAGNVTVAAQPNITSVGTLTSLAVAGNANVGNIGAAGGIFTYVTGDGGNLSNINSANITGAVAFATTANSVAGANVSGQVANALVASTVYTNAQPNITSVGTLVSLDVTGNVAAGNLTTGGNVVAAGNIQADTGFISNSLSTRTGPLTLTATGASDITLAVGTGNINLSTTAYITNVKDPVSAQDAATKNYVDLLAQGLKPKTSVQCATTASITLAAPGAAIDGHTLVSGDRVLVKNQATAAENGVYTYNGTGLVRATDSDTVAEMQDGVFVFVEFGSTYSASGFVQTAPVTTLGTDPVVFTQFSAGGSYTAGTGLTLTGSQFSVSATGVTAGSHGNATHIPTFTVTSTGQLTAAGNVAVTANAETLTGTFIPASVTTASGLTSVGTLTSLAVTGGVTAASFAGDGGNLSNIRAANVVGTMSSLTVAGPVNLGAIGNIAITGGTPGQVLQTNGSGAVTWATVAAGDVTGPASSTDNAVVRYDLTTGKIIQNSSVIIGDGGEVTGVSTLTTTGAVTVGGVSTLGPVGNVKITGGTNGQVLTTDGTGTLAWSTVAAGGPASASSVTSVAAGNLVATNVQDALNELDTEKLSTVTTSTLLSGTGVAASPLTIKALTAADDNKVLTIQSDGSVAWELPVTGGAGISAVSTSALLSGSGIPASPLTIASLTAADDNKVLTIQADGSVAWELPTAGSSTASAISSAPTGSIAATNVQAALAELDTEKVAIAGGTMTGSLILNANPTVALGAATKQYVDSITATGVAFTATGGIAATNVQTALAELDTEKLSTVTTSALLSGTGVAASPLTIKSLTAADDNKVLTIQADGSVAWELHTDIDAVTVWSATAVYAVNDLVGYAGGIYKRLVAGTTAAIPSTDTTNWSAVGGGTVTSAQVGAATAGLAVGAVGTYAFLRVGFVAGFIAVGSSVAATFLFYTNAAGADVASPTSGTWRLMGYINDSMGNPSTSSLFLRIA